MKFGHSLIRSKIRRITHAWGHLRELFARISQLNQSLAQSVRSIIGIRSHHSLDIVTANSSRNHALADSITKSLTRSHSRKSLASITYADSLIYSLSHICSSISLDYSALFSHSINYSLYSLTYSAQSVSHIRFSRMRITWNPLTRSSRRPSLSESRF